jgi:hypothetical protein
MKLLLENWREYLTFPKIVASYSPKPIEAAKVKDELILTGGDVGLLMWGSSMEDYMWYRVKFISDSLPKTKPLDPKRYQNQNIDNYKDIPPIFVLSDFKGDYCDEGEWNISVIDGEHRIYSYSDKLSQMDGFFGIQKNNCKAGIESFNAESLKR